MSASLPKMSNIITSNSLCYYKVPLEYNETTDTHKYTFTVASYDDCDTDFNTHIFNLGSYIPPSDPGSSLYRKVAVISGTKDSFYTNSRGYTIQVPIGFVKNNESNTLWRTDIEEDQWENFKIAGFKENSIDFSDYSYVDTVIEDVSYRAGLTGYNGNEADYWTFIARALKFNESEEIADGFYVFGTTLNKMTPSDISNNLLAAFNSYTITVLSLNNGEYAQMYTIEGDTAKIPSNLPRDYMLHTASITNALVLWEQRVAYVPNPIYIGDKQATALKIAQHDVIKIQNLAAKTVSQIDCYIQPSEISAKIGSITTKNAWYEYYDMYTTYDKSGKIELWFRIGNPETDNRCWIKYTTSGSTIFTLPVAQTSFYFRLNNDVENFNEFEWSYSVTTVKNNTSWSKTDSYFTGITTKWYPFRWQGNGPDYVFRNAAGQYLATDSDGGTLFYSDEFTDECVWNLVPYSDIAQTDSAAGDSDKWVIINKSSYNGVNRQVIQCNSNGVFTTVSRREPPTTSYLYDFYKQQVQMPTSEGSLPTIEYKELQSAPENGDVVCICYCSWSNNKEYRAISTTISGSNIAKSVVSVSGETGTTNPRTLVPNDTTAILTVSVLDNDTPNLSDIMGTAVNSAVIPGDNVQPTWAIAAASENLNSTTDTSYAVIYIRATIPSKDNLMPYKIAYLDSNNNTNGSYLGTDNYGSSVESATNYNPRYGRYSYIFKYIVPYASSVTFYDSEGTGSTTIKISNYSQLIITPVITDNRIQLLGNVKYDNVTYPNVLPTDVGYITFRQIVDDGTGNTAYVYGTNDKYPRGALIEADGHPKNGWAFNNIDGGAVFIVPTTPSIVNYVVTGNFSRKQDNITLKLTNTDTTLGSIKTNIEDKLLSTVTTGNSVEYTYSCAENDLIELISTPICLDSEGKDHNTGSVARWEYKYRRSDTGADEWRLFDDEENKEFYIHLYQKEGTSPSLKNTYEYRVFWGQRCVLY